jgi:hypothetical protein
VPEPGIVSDSIMSVSIYPEVHILEPGRLVVACGAEQKESTFQHKLGTGVTYAIRCICASDTNLFGTAHSPVHDHPALHDEQRISSHSSTAV